MPCQKVCSDRDDIVPLIMTYFNHTFYIRLQLVQWNLGEMVCVGEWVDRVLPQYV